MVQVPPPKKNLLRRVMRASNSLYFQSKETMKCGYIKRKGQDAALISLASQRPKNTFKYWVEIKENFETTFLSGK